MDLGAAEADHRRDVLKKAEHAQIPAATPRQFEVVADLSRRHPPQELLPFQHVALAARAQPVGVGHRELTQGPNRERADNL